MRRAALTFVLLASSLALGAHASADDAPSPAPSASASASATTSAITSAPVPAPLPPPSAVPAPLPPVVAPTAWAPTEEDPLRFLQLLRGEADRQRANRYFGGAVGLVGGGAVAIAGGLMLSAAGDSTPYRVYAYVTIGSGALIALSSLFSFFGRTGMERLADAYEPIAEDTKVPAATRLASGVQGLRALAASEHTARVVNGVTSIVTGVIIGGIGVYFALNTELRDTDRIVLAGLTGVSAATIIGSGVASLTWQRGPAEIAMEHWDAARGAPRVENDARLHVTPLLAPLHGGAAVGLSLSY